jgi:hypothetical protein
MVGVQVLEEAAVMASTSLWEEARAWIVSACLPIKPAGTLFDFVAALQNGALLCDLLNRMVPDSVSEIHRDGANVQVRFRASL